MRRILSIILTAVAAVCAASAQGLVFSGLSLPAIEEEPTRQSGLTAVYVLPATRGVTASWTGPEGRWSRFSVTGAAYAEPVSSSVVDGRSTVILTPDEDMGYVVEDAQGRQHCFWVVDYSLHRASLRGLRLSSDSDCSSSALALDGEAAPILYYSINGAPLTLDRGLVLDYTTLRYDEDTQDYRPEAVRKTLPDVKEMIYADAPLCNTTFTLSGDRFLQQWGQGESVTSPLYDAVAVEASATAQQAAGEHPDNELKGDYPLGGSAPCDITFSAAVTDAVVYREWQMSRYPDFDVVDYSENTDAFTYTFRDQGTTYVRFVCANAAGTCQYTGESFTVTIADSYLKCPNAFSPGNDDGVNDEWRVSYRSLLSYECHIFNRWGTELFKSTNPGEGWDGKKGGKTVPTGVYFYVIKAVGSDGKKYNLSGDINVLRYTHGTGATTDNPQFE